VSTVLGYVVQGNTELQDRLVDSALADFPVVGNEISRNVKTVHGSGVGLVIGLLVALYGGLGIANAAQNAMNRIWEVPMRERPGFVPRVLRSLELIGILGLAVLLTTAMSVLANLSSALGFTAWAALTIIAVACNAGLFLVAFHVLTAADVGWREHVPGAIVAAIAFQVLQAIGSWFVSRQLRGMSEVYGTFALVLGLLAWIFLEARVVLFAAETNVVRARRLWPRSLAPPPLTEADRRAYEAYEETEQRAPETTHPRPA
jgi:YihY family inner membrane protein